MPAWDRLCHFSLEAGLPVHDDQPSPVPLPNSPPTAVITTPNVLEHEIRLADTEFPNRGHRPRGATGCEIVGAFGDVAPVDMQSFHPMGMATRMTHFINFNVTDGGKTVWYRFRWVGTAGKLGGCSNLFSALVTK